VAKKPLLMARMAVMFGVLALMVVLGGLAACGGHNSNSTTSDCYTFTVTGTGAPAETPVPTTTFTLTIN
jgi:ABC-type glycerol-3-phosphate transport system substrate-binding protein